MMSEYYVPTAPATETLIVKRSKFHAFAYRVQTPAEAEQYLSELRRLHPQANHVCWAYIAGAPTTTSRSMSDDGEPSGTAGMPMLNVLAFSGVGEILVAVVRYFGGTKLGTGGLQRAYSDAVSLVLEKVSLTAYVERKNLSFTYGYSLENAFNHLFERFNCEINAIAYHDKIAVEVGVEVSQLDAFIQAARDISKGKIELAPDKIIYK